MAEGFVFLLACSPEPDATALAGTANRNSSRALSWHCRTATSTKGSLVIIRARNSVRPNHLFGHNFDHD
jgi:hypothetical protein